MNHTLSIMHRRIYIPLIVGFIKLYLITFPWSARCNHTQETDRSSSLQTLNCPFGLLTPHKKLPQCHQRYRFKTNSILKQHVSY